MPWLAGAIVAGGVLGPLLLMGGLARTDAAETISTRRILRMTSYGIFLSVIRASKCDNVPWSVADALVSFFRFLLASRR